MDPSFLTESHIFPLILTEGAKSPKMDLQIFN